MASRSLAPDSQFPKKCSCGALLDRAAWETLPFPPKGGHQLVEDIMEMEMRNHACGSTLVAIIWEAPEEG